MKHAYFDARRCRSVSAYVAASTVSQGAGRQGDCRQAGQTLGVYRRRSCLLPAFALFLPWAISAKWL